VAELSAGFFRSDGGIMVPGDMSPKTEPPLDGEDNISTLEELKTWFRESEDALFASRQDSERVRDYVDGKQWTADEINALNARGQSALVYNRMRQKVSILIGVEQQMRADPKAYPRTPQHDEEAQTATDALRYIADNVSFDKIASFVFDQACAVEGVAAVEIGIEYDKKGEPNITAVPFHFDRVGGDPHSRRPDYSDGRYVYTLTWMDAEQAKRKWPDRADTIVSTIATNWQSTRYTYDDTPRYWADRTRNRVQVVQMYWLEGEIWKVATFTGGGFLEDPDTSPYLCEDGEPSCALVFCSGYVTREGERQGAAHDWMGPQDDINKRRSKSLHMLSTRQTIADPNVIHDVRTMRAELAKPDGHVTKDGEGEFNILPTGDMTAGQLELLNQAKEEIEQTGPTTHNAMPTDPTGAMSGIALQSHQRSQMLGLSPLLDHHRDWKVRCYRAMWARVRQFWTREKWVRVTDDPRSMRWVGLNQPVTLGDQVEEELAQRVAQLEQEQPGAGQQLAQRYAADPRMAQVVDIKNQPGEIDVDIILDEGPDVVTTEAQEFDLLLRLDQQRPGQIPLPELIQASPLRNKERLLKHFEEDPQAAEAAQRAQQVQDEAVMSAIERNVAAAEKDRATAAKTAAETPSDIELNEAQADKATAEAASKASELGVVVPLTGLGT